MYLGNLSCQDNFGRKKCCVNLKCSILSCQKLRNSINLKEAILFGILSFISEKLYLSNPPFFNSFLSDNIVLQKLPNLENTGCTALDSDSNIINSLFCLLIKTCFKMNCS